MSEPIQDTSIVNQPADTSRTPEQSERPERSVHSERRRSSRSHSRSHSRRRHSRGRRHRHRRGFPKVPERNLLGAVCSMIAIVGTCTALAEGQWFTFHGGKCNDGKNHAIYSTGASTFMFPGSMSRENDTEVYTYSLYGEKMYMKSCVNSEAVAVMRSIITLCIIAITLALISFILDLIGPKRKFIMIVRRYGTISIVCLLVMVIVLGLSHYAANLIEDVQRANRRAKGSKVYVDFGISYYIVVVSAAANIFATACNLLRRYPPIESRRSQDREPIMQDMDSILRDEPVRFPPIPNEPPPYTP